MNTTRAFVALVTFACLLAMWAALGPPTSTPARMVDDMRNATWQGPQGQHVRDLAAPLIARAREHAHLRATLIARDLGDGEGLQRVDIAAAPGPRLSMLRWNHLPADASETQPPATRPDVFVVADEKRLHASRETPSPQGRALYIEESSGPFWQGAGPRAMLLCPWPVIDVWLRTLADAGDARLTTRTAPTSERTHLLQSERAGLSLAWDDAGNLRGVRVGDPARAHIEASYEGVPVGGYPAGVVRVAHRVGRAPPENLRIYRVSSASTDARVVAAALPFEQSRVDRYRWDTSTGAVIDARGVVAETHKVPAAEAVERYYDRKIDRATEKLSLWVPVSVGLILLAVAFECVRRRL